jgi:hypothetical protein
MIGEIFYSTLLLLYPKPFRTRFGREMIQLFRDCHPQAKRAGFWIETLKDLAVSVPREWTREVQREDSAIDYAGLGDAVLMSSVVGPLLLWWGWTVTMFILNADTGSRKVLFGNASGPGLIVFATLTMALLVGIVSAMAAARTGRIETTLWSKLDSYEKPTAQSLP